VSLGRGGSTTEDPGFSTYEEFWRNFAKHLGLGYEGIPAQSAYIARDIGLDSVQLLEAALVLEELAGFRLELDEIVMNDLTAGEAYQLVRRLGR